MRKGMRQMQSLDFICDIATQLRDAILPAMAEPGARTRGKTAFSGDTTFGIDSVAERALENALAGSTRKLAYFSEDRGLVKLAPEPDWLLMVDPIDGTRPLMCGFEAAVVSIALCDYSEVATFANIRAAVVLEIISGASFYVERGKGIETRPVRTVVPSATSDLSQMFWSFDIIGRPARLALPYLEDLINRSGMKGAPFLVNGAAFSMTRIVTGQMDAYVDIGGRILQEHPESEREFLAIGNGHVMGTFPYDIAAAYLLLKETGCVISDAFGKSFDNKFLVQHGRNAVMSCVAASNSKLHENILNALTEGK